MSAPPASHSSPASPLDLIELDAASNRGIDEVRQLRESAGVLPSRGRYKVYLVDEVHMLTEPAFNALLKTLEEPPPHVIFVLATTEPHKLPATILSRCQRFDFRRISLDAVVERLGVVAAGEGLTVADGGAELIARQATGSLRDAINLLDQLVAYHGRDLSLDAVRSGLGLVVDDRAGALAAAAVRRDLAAGLTVLAAARDDGIEIRAFMRQAVAALRSVLALKAGGEERLGLADAELEELRPLAEEASPGDIVAALRALGAIDFGGDAYDSLPAEIAFASLVVEPEAETVASPPATAEPAAAEPAPAQQPRQPTPPRPATVPLTAAPRTAAPPPPVASRPAPSTPVVPADEGEVTPQLAELRGKWESIRAAARKRNFKAGALLNTQCHVKQFEGDTVEIGFKSAFMIEKANNLEEGKVFQAIGEVVSEAVGRPVEVVPALWEELSQSRDAPASEESADGGHLVEEAQKLGAERVAE